MDVRLWGGLGFWASYSSIMRTYHTMRTTRDNSISALDDSTTSIVELYSELS